jgi:DNA-directed RNA polymerase subunit RPC12/RpoP
MPARQVAAVVDQTPPCAYRWARGTRVGITDTITFICSACGHSADFPKAQVGKAIYCPKCQAAQVVKGAGASTDRFRAERIPTGRIVKAEGGASDGEAAAHGMAGTARLDFLCGACNHTSRISAALAGQPVRCPTCGTVQLAGVAGLRVVRLDGQGKLPFECTSCSYQARLNPEYAGKAIRCPKCQGAQVVPRVQRDPSGTHPTIPAGGAAVRSEPGTAAVRRPATGSIAKAPSSTERRSEPSAALRTPAGGITVPQPMPMPTPLPGKMATPPPGLIRTPSPERSSSASALALPSVPTDDADSGLDLGDGAPGAVPGEPAAARPRGGVVRRSGRIQTQRQPQSGDEPTLEPARAVQPEPEQQFQEGAVQAPTAAVDRPARAAWLAPVLGVLAVVALTASLALVVMLNAAGGRESSLQQQLRDQGGRIEASTAEIEGLRQKLVEAEAGRKLVASERDELRSGFDALRRDHEQLKAETDRLKAAAAASPSPPAHGQPSGK